MASKQRPGREARKPPAKKAKASGGPCQHPKKLQRVLGWGTMCECGTRVR